jgi:hypothetical protein
MEEDHQRKRLSGIFRFTLRDVFWLLVVISLLLAWHAERGRLTPYPPTIDRSWRTGSVNVHFGIENGRYTAGVRGDWPDATPDLWIRGTLWLTQNNGKPDVCIAGASNNKLSEEHAFTTIGQLSAFSDPPDPFQAVYDYEIWQGEPGRGRILTKQSAFSTPITETTAGNGDRTDP